MPAYVEKAMRVPTGAFSIPINFTATKYMQMVESMVVNSIMELKRSPILTASRKES